MCSRIQTEKSTARCSAQIERLRTGLAEAEAVLIGAGAGLSAAAGLSYSGARFEKHFADFIEKYHFTDLYTGGFYPFAAPEEYWAWWSRHIYWNRYVDAPKPVYQDLLALVEDKDYFVLTTNVDHQFQRAGFDKNRLFYTQGDYGLFQCSEPCHAQTYDNEQVVQQMLEQQQDMRVPRQLIPHCPICDKPMSMNLRADNTFVQDKGWYAAAKRYEDFLQTHQNDRLLLLELGVGGNTPAIIKYPFWRLAQQKAKVTYACINRDEAVCPPQLRERSICVSLDIGRALGLLLQR